MKLVDILARELKVWPEGLKEITQGSTSGVLRNKNFAEISPLTYLTVADDSGDPNAIVNGGKSSSVTRAQWQAAVDALKAPLAATGEYLDPIAELPFSNEKRIEWNGEGLPPARVEFEWRYGDHAWKGGEALYIGSVYVILKASDGEQHYYLRDMQFRPIRTPEQIAADEREREIADLYFTINWNEGRETWPIISSGRKADYAKAIDAGYRKPETKEY